MVTGTPRLLLATTKNKTIPETTMAPTWAKWRQLQAAMNAPALQSKKPGPPRDSINVQEPTNCPKTRPTTFRYQSLTRRDPT